MRYLGLESSCDETAIAVWDSEERQILYEQVLTQIDLHQSFGGVVPGIAIREHLKGFQILLEKFNETFDFGKIDYLVVTHGPGLIGCLGMGVAYAQAIQLLLNIPVAGINHLQGHAFSPFLEKYQEDKNFVLKSLCPHLGLLVSGGNTLLFVIECKGNKYGFKILAQTVDDAAGEALDKGAKMLNFPYPGGPYIEKCAQKGDNQFIQFPRAFPQKDEWKFSFSGLKTSLRYYLEKKSLNDVETEKASICASYQQAVIDALVKKVEQACKQQSFKSLGLSGGVANNDCLRRSMEKIANRYGMPFFIPSKHYCGDNAAMIAFTGNFMQVPLKLNPNRTLEETI